MSLRTACVALLLVAASAAVPTAGPQNGAANRLTPEEQKAGWTLLFDGHVARRLARLQAPRRRRHAVEGRGRIPHAAARRRHATRTGSATSSPRAPTSSSSCRWEWRIAKGGNSGVKYFVLEDRDAAIGHEYQVIDDAGHPDAKVGPHRQTAAFYDVLPAADRPIKPAGEWNTTRRSSSSGKSRRALAERQRACSSTSSTARRSAPRSPKSKFKDIDRFGKPADGHILLQDHGNQVWYPQHQDPQAVIRVGLLGAGNISDTHARAAKAIPGVEIAAVCGANREKVERLAATYGGAVYDDVGRFLDHRPLDVVAIGSPSGLHAEQTIAAIRRGLHVIVGKAAGRHDREGGRRHRRGGSQGGQGRRVLSGSPQARHRDDEDDDRRRDALGTPIFAAGRVRWYRPPEYYAASRWRGTWALDGGGALMNQGIHTVDLLHWLFGPVAKVAARTATRLHSIEVEDTAAAVHRVRERRARRSRGDNVVVSRLRAPARHQRIGRNAGARGGPSGRHRSAESGRARGRGRQKPGERVVANRQRQRAAPACVRGFPRRPRGGTGARLRRARSAAQRRDRGSDLPLGAQRTVRKAVTPRTL